MHAVWLRTFGDADRPPIVLLHGGPGSGTSDRLPRLFDPARWRVITMDQRGSGGSHPHAGHDVTALRANTTTHLVADLERLRTHLGVQRWTVFGASWGATLAQAYTHAHRARVAGLILAAVTTTGRAELDMLYGGTGAFLPEAFEAFRAGAPMGEPGVGMAAAYGDLLTSGDPAIEAEAASAWCLWEEAVIRVDPRAEPTGRFADPAFRLGFARVVTHYFRRLAWLDPPLLDRAPELAGLPVTMINSRFDLSSPLETAWRLHRAILGSELVVVPGSLHRATEGPLAKAVIAAGRRRADLLRAE